MLCETARLARWGHRSGLTAMFLVIEAVAQERCQRADTAFRGRCGTDGQPEAGWCVVCRADRVIGSVMADEPDVAE